jgi:hypothetical protein
MAWNDAQLSGHKKAQAKISMATATLGLSALGAKGFGSAIPRLTKAPKLLALAPKANRAATNLTIGGAGIGGVGGFNFAGIQNTEAKRKVSKSMSAIDFGMGTVHQGSPLMDVSKALDTKQKAQLKRTATGAAAVGAGFGLQKLGARKVAQGGKLMNAYRSSSSLVRGAINEPKLIAAVQRKQLTGQALNGAGIGTMAGGAWHALSEPQKKTVRKAYDPERGRAKRLSSYQSASNATAGALGAGAGFAGTRTVRQAKALPKVMLDPARGPMGVGPHKFKATKALPLGELKPLGRSAALTAGLGVGAVGAAMAAHRVGQYRQSSGRAYRPLGS